MKSKILGLILLCGAAGLAMADPVQVDAAFPSGNIRVVRQERRFFTLAPDLRDTSAWWFHFNFRLDMHCPYISGKWNDRAYLVGAAEPAAAAKERAFARVLEKAIRGPIPFRADECYLASGVDWNNPGNYTAGKSNATWAREAFPAARFAGTIEIAYADALGAEVTADSARAFGRDLARAILLLLER